MSQQCVFRPVEMFFSNCYKKPIYWNCTCVHNFQLKKYGERSRWCAFVCSVHICLKLKSFTMKHKTYCSFFIVHSFMHKMHYCLLANLRHLQTIALCDMWWSKSLFISFTIRIKILIFNLIFIHFRFQVALPLSYRLSLNVPFSAVVSTRCVRAQTPHQCSSIISIVRLLVLFFVCFHRNYFIFDFYH